MSRGTCQFVDKTFAAQQAGALAVLIADNDPVNTFFDMGGFNPDVTITAFRLSYDLGASIAGQASSTLTTVRVALGNNLVSNLPAMPEPASWAMFIGGFGFIGGAMRRRQSVRVTLA